ncbi:hypothetical protein PALI_a3836 [Pseudoalteromonas aliena SW19]|jgi:hypothetical protein|uniref:Bacteriocin n=1 Tax=Pseudoalteromonas aliena SW19 TaxID=1314866 RepID=A0ABR9DUS2_9GAMM|nr:hypothetical protein [Pseudoalteromonas aliena SW19]
MKELNQNEVQGIVGGAISQSKPPKTVCGPIIIMPKTYY